MKTFGFLSLVCGLVASLQASLPSTLNYQGRVLQNGQPFEGTGHFVFGIYEGSTLLWTNKLPVPSPLNDPAAAIDSSDAKALTVRNGVFNVRLGEGDANNAPVGTDVFFKFDGTQRVRTDVKLAVWFSPAAEGPYTRLDPDITFASVPFAQVAGVAETVKDGVVEPRHLSANAVTGTAIAPDTIASDDLTPAVREALNPPGTILPFGGTVAPAGYLMCDGQAYPKTTYPALALVVGTAFGGDGTTFRVPDLRGRLLRGTDDPDGAGLAHLAAGRDPDVLSRTPMNSGGSSGNAVGSVQADQFKSHSHPLRGSWSTVGAGPVTFTSGTVANSGLVDGSAEAVGGNETRPVNAYVNYIIKY